MVSRKLLPMPILSIRANSNVSQVRLGKKLYELSKEGLERMPRGNFHRRFWRWPSFCMISQESADSDADSVETSDQQRISSPPEQETLRTFERRPRTYNFHRRFRRWPSFFMILPERTNYGANSVGTSEEQRVLSSREQETLWTSERRSRTHVRGFAP